MTTVTAILLTQLPIAIACFWVAWEMHKMGKALVRFSEEVARLAKRQQDDKTP